MKITQDLQQYAEIGMRQKSAEFVAGGAEVYR